jgi:uncharacterized protein (TIGR03437 family)
MVRLLLQMASREKCAGLLFFVLSAAAQTRPMSLQQTRYELRMGEPAAITASSDTLEFLRNAQTRRVDIAGSPAGSLVVAPNRAGQVVLAASMKATPGEYTATISATSASGEVRQTSMTVAVKPRVSVPSNSTRNPVVLLNGWETGFTNSCPVSNSSADTFGNLAQYLVADGVPVVYLFDNCLEDPNQSIETLGNDLGAFLKTIIYDNGTQVPQIDLIGFSMGGLIARSYLAGLQPSTEALTPPATTLVGKLILIATPNFGSFVAGNYTTTIPAGTQSAELIPGSVLLWNLANWNQRSDDLRGVSAIAIVGNAGAYLPGLSAATQLNNATDGIVSLTSASIGFVAEQASATRIVPYCHVDPSAFVNTTLGTYLCNAAGIANVRSESHLTSEIVRSFLAGTSDWQSIGTTPATDPYLSKNGGMFFALLNGAGAFASDLTQVQWGTLQLTNGGDTNVIYYDDFVAGAGAFQATSTSLGRVNCGSYTQAFGYFSALRCKLNAAIFSIGPLVSTIPRVVSAGGTITIAGADFSSKCINCNVTATPAGSSSAQTLQINAWTNTSITAVLPSTLTGLLTITVHAATGSDSLTIMAATPNLSTIAASPAGLQFSYVAGGTAPPSQSIQIANSGSGTLAWTATASDSWLSVSPASGTAPSTLSVSISPASLSAGTYKGSVQITASGASNSPQSIPVTLTVTQPAAVPNITMVTNAGSFAANLASATWVSIFGTNLSTDTYTWQDSDFANGQLPTSLHGVSVTINGVPAFVEFISPAQINVLAPDDAPTGSVQVQVTVAQQTSNSFSVPKNQFSPAFFTIGNGAYVAALHSDYTLVGGANLLAGVTTRPAQPGETIQLYATGFGPTSPAHPSSQLVSTPAALANQVQVTIGGMPANVTFAGLVESGTYQLNVTVPNLPNGDAPVVATVGGVATQTGVSVTVQQ